MKTLFLLPIALLIACDSGGVEGDTTASGQSYYKDADSDPDGSEREWATPEPQSGGDSMVVTIEADGNGTFSLSDPECSLDGATGAFEGLYEGEADIDSDGFYVASLASADAVFTTPSGCTIPSLTIDVVNEVVVRGELTTTTQNCETYCQAKARSYAESECEGDADEATCRSDAEAAYEGDCTTTCDDPTTHVIVAETSLSTTAIADINSQALTGEGLGEVQADLTFDHMEDDQGDDVDDRTLTGQ